MDHVLHHGLLVHRARRPGQAEPPGCVGLNGYNGELPLRRAPAAPNPPLQARRQVNSGSALRSDRTPLEGLPCTPYSDQRPREGVQTPFPRLQPPTTPTTVPCRPARQRWPAWVQRITSPPADTGGAESADAGAARGEFRLCTAV